MVDLAFLVQAITPIATFWVVFNSQREAVTFLNNLRDTIIIRYKENHELTIKHRNSVYLDWKLTYLTAIFAFTLFSGLITWGTFQIYSIKEISYVSWPIGAIAIYMWITTTFFILGGLNDRNLIRESLNV